MDAVQLYFNLFLFIDQTNTFEHTFEEKVRKYNEKSQDWGYFLKEVFVVVGVIILLVLFGPFIMAVILKQSKKLKELSENQTMLNGNQQEYCN